MQKTSLTYSLIILSVFAVSYLSMVTLPAPTVQWLRREDGPFETFGALCFLASSLIFLILYLKEKRGNHFFSLTTKRNVFFFLLCLLFFFAFGEEIAWGQRIFGFATPQSIAEMNLQGDFTIHNLEIFAGTDASGQRKSELALLLSIGRLFSLFWFLYCVLIPLGVYFHRGMATHLGRLNLPIVPIWLGLLFPVNYLFSKILEFGGYHSVEIKESLFGFLFMMVAAHFLQRSRTVRVAADLK